jgi:hypothetical protein
VAFFCGVIQEHPGSRLARAGWSWPMGRVDLGDSGVRLYTPVLVGRWTLDLPYEEIAEAVVRRYSWGGKIRLRRDGGDVTVTTMGAGYVRLGDLLREKGVRIADEGGSVGTSG